MNHDEENIMSQIARDDNLSEEDTDAIDVLRQRIEEKSVCNLDLMQQSNDILVEIQDLEQEVEGIYREASLIALAEQAERAEKSFQDMLQSLSKAVDRKLERQEQLKFEEGRAKSMECCIQQYSF